MKTNQILLLILAVLLVQLFARVGPTVAERIKAIEDRIASQQDPAGRKDALFKARESLERDKEFKERAAWRACSHLSWFEQCMDMMEGKP